MIGEFIGQITLLRRLRRIVVGRDIARSMPDLGGTGIVRIPEMCGHLTN
jgi:hypothetical protein